MSIVIATAKSSSKKASLKQVLESKSSQELVDMINGFKELQVSGVDASVDHSLLVDCYLKCRRADANRRGHETRKIAKMLQGEIDKVFEEA